MTSKVKIKNKLYNRLCECCASDIATYKIKYKCDVVKIKRFICDDCINNAGYKKLEEYIITGKVL